MVVVRRLYRERIVPAALWLAALVGGFLEEAIFRLGLAFDVLRGRKPQQLERRWWNRGVEVPTLVDVYDWTTARLLFSVLVWPPLESDLTTAERDHRHRVEEVLEAIAKGGHSQGGGREDVEHLLGSVRAQMGLPARGVG